MEGIEIDLDKLYDAFGQLFKDMGLDESDDQLVYNTITVFMASLIASGIQEEYGDNPVELEAEILTTCSAIAEDLEEKIRAKATPAKKSAGGKRDNSASDVVLEKIQRSKKGEDMQSLKKKTGYDDKKIRNIVHRLYKLEKIKRVGRGTYVGS